MTAGTALVPVEDIARRILTIRGLRVILDSDLASLYGVTTKQFNQQVRRNHRRFPSDFMFRLTKDEAANLKSQFVTSSLGWGGRRKPHNAFTEHGAVMAATVLSSPRAVQMSIFVVRAFLRLRGWVVGRGEEGVPGRQPIQLAPVKPHLARSV